MGSKTWANDQLRLAIAILDDRIEGYRCPVSGRLADALTIMRNLREYGFWWQIRTLEFHIHRFQKNHKKALAESRGNS